MISLDGPKKQVDGEPKTVIPQSVLCRENPPRLSTRLQICHVYIFGNKATDGTYGSISIFNIGFQGLALIQGPNLQP